MFDKHRELPSYSARHDMDFEMDPDPNLNYNQRNSHRYLVSKNTVVTLAKSLSSTYVVHYQILKTKTNLCLKFSSVGLTVLVRNDENPNLIPN